MFSNFFKIIVILLSINIFVFAGGKIVQASEEEEIRDTIVVHGMVLYGQVMNLGPEKLSFKLLYSEGLNHIAYKDIESISTKYNYHISFKRMDIEGRVLGIEDSKYLNVIESNGDLRTIRIADIDNFVMSVVDDDSFENIVRNKLPYIRGNVNVGLELENGNSKKNKVDLQLNLRQKQAEHEVSFFLDYAFETTETEETDKVQNKDELVSILTYKNNFKNDQFYYAALSADYDRPRHIQNRFIPSMGYGHRYRFAKRQWIEPSIGLGYATTQYTDNLYPDKDFSVAALQLSGKYELDDLALINTLIIDGFMVYYPSLENPGLDWIFRSNINFTVPLFDFLSIKLAYSLINDSNPNPDVGNNKTTTKLLFGLDF
jgi:putative salt-induced outer membrane protein YdiY